MELGNQTLSDPHTVSCMTIWLVRDLTHFSAGTPRKTRGDVVPGEKSEETWMFLYNRCQFLHQKMGGNVSSRSDSSRRWNCSETNPVELRVSD